MFFTFAEETQWWNSIIQNQERVDTSTEIIEEKINRAISNELLSKIGFLIINT